MSPTSAAQRKSLIFPNRPEQSQSLANLTLRMQMFQEVRQDADPFPVLLGILGPLTPHLQTCDSTD